MSLRLSGINPLSYMGVEPYTPPALVIRPFPPTVNDFQNINLGTFWLVRPNSVISLWVLISVEGGTATWVQLYPAGGGGSGASEFPTDSMTANELDGVLNILGDTRVTTSGDGNTVTLHLNGSVPSLFTTNDGNATPSGGTLEILGGSNINTFGSGNTVEVNLNTSVTLAGALTVGTTVTVDTFGAGVVQSNASGLLESSNGTEGQVLIGGGSAPVWANLTSDGGTVTITEGANSINLETTGGGGPAGTVAFYAYQTSEFTFIFPYNVQPVAYTPYLMGSLDAMTLTFNEGDAFYPGDGVGGPAIFTAPVNGNYYFEFNAYLQAGRTQRTGTAINLKTSNYVQIISPTAIYANALGFITDSTNQYSFFVLSVSASIPLSSGDQVQFRILGPASPSAVMPDGYAFIVNGPFAPTGQAPWNQLNYLTSIQGYLI